MRRAVLIAVLAWAAMLTGCATSTVNSQVQSFSAVSVIQPGTTAAIWGGEKHGSLEFKAVSDLVAPYLAAAGYRVVSMDEQPDHVVAVAYGIDDGQMVQQTTAIPMFGQTGVASSTTFGSVNTYGSNATFNATTFNTPTYGITGFQPITTNATVYSRVVLVDIIDRKASTPDKLEFIYQAEIKSRGSCGNVHAVLGEIVGAAFKSFPGPASRSEMVSAPWDGTC